MESRRCCSSLFSLCVGLCILNVARSTVLVYSGETNRLIDQFYDFPANFGPSLSSSSVRGYGITAYPDQYGCHDLHPPPKTYSRFTKYIAIIRRGGQNCSFELKVRKAQSVNYHAVIIYNNDSDDLEHMSAENTSGIIIPSVFVGQSAGLTLMALPADCVLVINGDLPFNINTQLILPFSILIGLCFLIMIFYMIYRCIREERRLRRYRLPKRLLRKLPIITFTKNIDLGYDTCVICLENFAEGDKLRVLPCRHPYHSECIDVWLTENKRECPICKRKVFTKGFFEARSLRNRQSSLDSMPDTDDDTTPLLQNSTSSVVTDTTASSATIASTRHGTFNRTGGVNNNVEAGGGYATSDDENMLTASAQRINPFDRSPNLPPHLASQLNGDDAPRNLWSWPVFRWFRRPVTISVAAPPYLEDTLSEVVAPLPPYSAAVSATHSSNNVLNPNLSGSLKGDDDDDDDAPLQCIYEPAAPTQLAAGNATQPENAIDNNTNNDSVFIQTPTQGGIAVAALPPHIGNDQAASESMHANHGRHW